MKKVDKNCDYRSNIYYDAYIPKTDNEEIIDKELYGYYINKAKTTLISHSKYSVILRHKYKFIKYDKKTNIIYTECGQTFILLESNMEKTPFLKNRTKEWLNIL